VVVIYARGPADNSLWEYAVRRGWEDVQVVTDADVLMRAVRLGKVSVLLCSTLNGLGRSLSHLVQQLREFVSRRVVLIVPNQGIDTSKASSKVFLDTLDAIEEFKRAAATERIREGLIAAKARGVRLGRPVKIAAYRDDVNRLRGQGLTGRAIAKELGIPSSSVFKLIKGTSLKR
jgi:DNA invertase Pin-like site-specific DNA recombinase